MARPLPAAVLARQCRSLATLLDSGVTLLKALSVSAGKTGDARANAAVEDVRRDVKRGMELHEALRARGGTFPPLMVDLVAVADRTGAAPETLRGLADHFESMVRLRKAFLAQIAWPVFQLVAAVGVIGLVIYILGMIGDFDPLGLGLLGASGAAVWFGTAGAVAAAGASLWFVGRRTVAGRWLDPALLAVPVLGKCLRNFALARFSWAFSLTQNAGMPIDESLTASLSATGNRAFADAGGDVWSRVRAGEELTDGLRATDLFPEDYLQMLAVAEASGSVPETLERIGPDLEADARRSLSALAAAVGWVVWALVAAFIVWIIFQMVLRYVAILNGLAEGNLDVLGCVAW